MSEQTVCPQSDATAPPEALARASKLCRSTIPGARVELIFQHLQDAQVVHKWLVNLKIPAAAPVTGDQPETGWLLEKMHNGNVHYVSADHVLTWTDDPNKALRLSRREDAEALCTIVEDCEKIASHEWVPAAAPAAPSPGELPDSCAWTLDDSNDGEIWETSCGQAFSFTDGGVKDNRFVFCYKCGKRIDPGKYSDHTADSVGEEGK